MHKSICDEYTKIPAILSFSAVPVGIGALQTVFQTTSTLYNNIETIFIGASVGFAGAVVNEFRLQEKAYKEKWGVSKSSRRIQLGQLSAYGVGLSGGILTSVYMAMASPENDNQNMDHQALLTEQKYEQSHSFDVSEQNPLYHIPD